MEVVVLVLFLVVGALILLRGPKAKEAERKRMEALDTDLLAGFSDAELVGEVERRRLADPEGFARRVETGERASKAAADVLAAELSRENGSGYTSGYSDGSFFSR